MSTDALSVVKGAQFGSANRKVVMMILADYADDQWSCFPRQTLIAEQAELGERTVRRLLSALEKDGWISRRPRYADGHRVSDRIYLDRDRLIDAGHSNRPTRPVDSHTGQPRQPYRPTTTVHTGQALAGEPSVEPSVEPPPSPPRSEPTPAADTSGGVETNPQGPPSPALTASERRARLYDACMILAKRTVSTDRPGITNPAAYLAGAAGRLTETHATAGHRHLAEHPDMPALVLADLLEGTRPGELSPDEQRARQRQREEETQRHIRDTLAARADQPRSNPVPDIRANLRRPQETQRA